jgi:hypothetical protein
MGSYLCTPETQKRYKKREHSSVGLEHLPYKQRVTGSTPVAPTSKSRIYNFFVIDPFLFAQDLP